MCTCRLSDVLMRRMKLLLVLMFTLSLFAIIAFALDVSCYVPFNIGWFFCYTQLIYLFFQHRQLNTVVFLKLTVNQFLVEIR